MMQNPLEEPDTLKWQQPYRFDKTSKKSSKIIIGTWRHETLLENIFQYKIVRRGLHNILDRRHAIARYKMLENISPENTPSFATKHTVFCQKFVKSQKNLIC